MRSSRKRSAFTLIELLVVITIIVFLIAVLSRVFLNARTRANETAAKSDIQNFTTVLEVYHADQGFYPGFDDPPGTDSAAKMYEALFGKHRVDGGGGGINSPYHEFQDERIAVEGGPTGFRMASREEKDDPEVKKYIFDPWDRPYHYVENDEKPEKTDDMHRPHKFDIWSDGPNRVNDNGEKDDVAPWNK
ncbi:MAG: prepilin-type N-terminal cleavage/methylation domain-containing protein [Planctomycetota bacterium]|nr:prepilin-type N-terminal cleavage/methylation domain-containing protein [Planctomycetota bacterium]